MFKSRLFLCCLCDPGQVNLTIYILGGNTCSTCSHRINVVIKWRSCSKGVTRHPAAPVPPTPSQPKTEELETLLLGPSRRSGKDANLIALPWGQRRRAPLTSAAAAAAQATIPARLPGSLPPAFPRFAPFRQPPTRRAPLLPPGGAWTPARGGCTVSPPRACSSRSGWGPDSDRLGPGSLESSPPQVRRGEGGREVAAYRELEAPWTARSPWCRPRCACALASCREV